MSIRVEHPTDRPNFYIVHTDRMSVAFSYQTPIGYRVDDSAWIVRANDWNVTTGKHINYLNDSKNARLDGPTWMAAYEAASDRVKVG